MLCHGTPFHRDLQFLMLLVGSKCRKQSGEKAKGKCEVSCFGQLPDTTPDTNVYGAVRCMWGHMYRITLNATVLEVVF